MRLLFLKLGGSLITDKTRQYTARLDKLDSLAAEIASILSDDPELHLILGHGSGSFGHSDAGYHATRLGVYTHDDWRGFTEVWYQAAILNRLVMDALHRADLPAVTLSPAASVTAHDGSVFRWDIYPIQAALSNNLIPVVHGDVAFDEIRGGTILSTEELFAHLARQLHPQHIFLAGLEAGVWQDFPSRECLVREITPGDISHLTMGVGAASGTDVTGGMESKVTGMLALVEEIPDLDIWIFSGEQPGNIHRAILGDNPGTRLHR
jgi:isopentenyl phosphate kinase